MAEFINYFWQGFFCLCFFFGVYWVFLRNEKSFRINRAYLLVTPILALLFPLVEIPVSFDKPSISLENSLLTNTLKGKSGVETVGTFGLPEVTVTATKLPFLWDIKDYLLLIYFFVALVLSFKLFWQCLQLRQLKDRGWYQAKYKLEGEYLLIPTFGLAPIFSFFDKLFWDDTQKLSPEEEHHIIQHELEHIHQKHSWDILYYQVLSIVFWFNPVIHLMRMALVDLHEYLADEKVLGQIENKASYSKLIVKMAFKGLDLPIGNYFIRSTTLKRLTMMRKSAKINWFKLAMVFPLTAMLFGLVSMKTENGLGFLSEYHTVNQATIRQQMLAFQDSLGVSIKVRTLKNPAHYEQISSLEGDVLMAQLGELGYEFSGISSDADYLKVRELIHVLRSNSQIEKTYENAHNRHTVEVFPQPKDGWKVFEDYLRSQVTEPEREKKLGLKGMVELEFVVDKEGKIQYPAIRKSFGGGVDEQLLEALKNNGSPVWNPGMENGSPVAVVVNFGVGFDFNEGKEQHEASFPQFEPVENHFAAAPSATPNEEILDRVETMPFPAGGMEEWYDYIRENLTYPAEAAQIHAKGKVYVSFIVDKHGNIGNPKILSGAHESLNKEALRFIENSPPWNPGLQNGEPVNVKMTLPIRFSPPVSDQNDVLQEFITTNGDWKEGNIQPGDAFSSHLRHAIRYPKSALQENISGTVLAKLYFDKNGKIENFQILQGLGSEINAEVRRLLKSAPNWEVIKPKESFQAIYPITFKLDKQSLDGPDFNEVFGKGLVVTSYPSVPSASEKIASEVARIHIVNDRILSFYGTTIVIDDRLSKRLGDVIASKGLEGKKLTIYLKSNPDVKAETLDLVRQALKEHQVAGVVLTYSAPKSSPDVSEPPAGSTLSEVKQPLFVVDGVVNYNMAELAVETIESISVIKEPKSIELYGKAARHGAIIIKTKKLDDTSRN